MSLDESDSAQVSHARQSYGGGAMFKGLRQGIGHQQRRAFWEATIAVCAFVTFRGGKVNFSTRLRIDSVLDSLPDLKDFDRKEFFEKLDQFVGEYRLHPREARLRALEVAKLGASNSDEAELIARIALACVDTEAPLDRANIEPIEALCGELGVDARALFAAAWINQDGDIATQPTPQAGEPSVETIIAATVSSQETDLQQERASPASVISQPSTGPGLSQQLVVNGTMTVSALCRYSKAAAPEVLCLYENERHAAADRELSERIANEKFWLSPVVLFPAGCLRGEGVPLNHKQPIHVLCLRRPDGNIELLRAFESADHANKDLEFFRIISDYPMWVSETQFKPKLRSML